MLSLLAGCLLAVGLLVAGARELVRVSGWRREVTAVLLDDAPADRSSGLVRWDRRFRRTRLGAWVERSLVLSGVERSPLLVTAVAVLGTAAVCYLLWVSLAPLFGVLGLLVGLQGLRVFLARARDRRREQFVAQMPELARVLANATGAGLSLRTALEIAAEELGEPARAELSRVARGLAFGASLEASLSAVQERLPSREVSLLISTLLVSARSGGSLVSALRDIADTLDNRKEVRREVRTVLAQALVTGYMVIGMGVALLFVLNASQPGTVQKMTVEPLGQAALLIAGTLYTVGALTVRRMTRVEP